VPDEDERRRGLRVHPNVEEQSEFFESALLQEVGLVDDDDRGLLALVGQDVEAAPDGQHHLLAKHRHWLAESGEHFPIEPRDADEGVGGVDDGVAGRVEAVDEGPQGGGLARADLAGDEADPPLTDEVSEPHLELLLTRGREELGSGEPSTEGCRGEAIELQKHLPLPPDRIRARARS
jgi:hypothetical protein